MSPLLDRPLFTLKPDVGPMNYANVSNVMQVAAQGKETAVCVAVDTSLFTLMRKLGISPESEVILYLDELKRGCVFGIMVDSSDVYDLWRLPKHLPEWIADAL